MATSSVAGTVGAILFGIAIWRDGRSPRLTGVIFALSVALLAVPIAFATELLGAMLLLISASVMWWNARQRSAVDNRPTGFSEQQAGLFGSAGALVAYLAKSAAKNGNKSVTKNAASATLKR